VAPAVRVMAVLSSTGVLSGPGGGSIGPTALSSGAGDGRAFGVVLDRTAFYSEAGGQVGDTGVIEVAAGGGGVVRLRVVDAQAFGGFVLHTVVVDDAGDVGGDGGGGANWGLDVGLGVEPGASAVCRVDYDRRRKVAPNHTLTHALNHALREVLGGSVDQKVRRRNTTLPQPLHNKQ